MEDLGLIGYSTKKHKNNMHYKCKNKHLKINNKKTEKKQVKYYNF